jgi:hypothetical protein
MQSVSRSGGGTVSRMVRDRLPLYLSHGLLLVLVTSSEEVRAATTVPHTRPYLPSAEPVQDSRLSQQ